jgi:NAD(P)-dependent dehydrogenase (short-subunit alcohol dehydrogenase family)
MRQFRGKVAVITGAASGMGRAMANRFAEEGMHVVLADVEPDSVEKAAAEIRERGLDALGVQTDVSSADSVEALAARTLEEYGAVHVVCNNAGVGGTAAVGWEVPLQAWEWMLGVNLLGVVHGVRTFLPRLVEQGEGHMVNTSSMAGVVPGVGSTPYTASKYAVSGLTESLRLELEMVGSPVKVSVLLPGAVNTNIGKALRNWPDRLGPVPEERQSDRVGALVPPPELVDMLAEPMDPKIVGDLVFEGLRAERFWIVTHPDAVGALIDARTSEIVKPAFTEA